MRHDRRGGGVGESIEKFRQRVEVQHGAWLLGDFWRVCRCRLTHHFDFFRCFARQGFDRAVLSTRQRFASYSRLVKPARESDGVRYGFGGVKIGNPYLKWAFSELVVHSVRFSRGIEKRLRRLESKYGPSKGKALMRHKFGRAIYHMLQKGQVFGKGKFLRH